jgi:hypothetical protein
MKTGRDLSSEITVRRTRLSIIGTHRHGTYVLEYQGGRIIRNDSGQLSIHRSESPVQRLDPSPRQFHGRDHIEVARTVRLEPPCPVE